MSFTELQKQFKFIIELKKVKLENSELTTQEAIDIAKHNIEERENNENS